MGDPAGKRGEGKEEGIGLSWSLAAGRVAESRGFQRFSVTGTHYRSRVVRFCDSSAAKVSPKAKKHERKLGVTHEPENAFLTFTTQMSGY
jgi:hypothetical protein